METVGFSAKQFARLDTLLGAIANALWAINEQLKPLDNVIDNNTTEVTKWLGVVAEAINNIQPLPQPEPTPRGTIMATFKVAADNPDIEISLTGAEFTDSEGNPTGAGDIDLSVESSNPDAVSVTLGEQTVSEDGNSVSVTATAHFGAPATDIATLTYRATNRDTTAVVAVGTDDFIVEVGEAGVGTITSSVPLTPEP